MIVLLALWTPLTLVAKPQEPTKKHTQKKKKHVVHRKVNSKSKKKAKVPKKEKLPEIHPAETLPPADPAPDAIGDEPLHQLQQLEDKAPEVNDNRPKDPFADDKDQKSFE